MRFSVSNHQAVKVRKGLRQGLSQSIDMAKTAGGAVKRTLVATMKGDSPKASDQNRDRRLSICKACEFFEPSFGMCSKCNCFMRFKTWLATEHCPIDKW